jgi:BlaI family penicillinase repressor
MHLSDSEWRLMNALWQAHPATAREVAERLPADNSWAYTTIKTMLTRLAAKGAVSETKRGNTSVYEPLVTRDRARRSALGSLLDQAFDGAVQPLLAFLARERKLTDRQREELERILAAEERRTAPTAASGTGSGPEAGTDREPDGEDR